MTVTGQVVDQAVRAMKKFNDRARWKVYPNVAIFDAHDEFDERKTIKDDVTGEDKPNPEYGKVKRRFDAKKLNEIAANCNRRFKRTGDACPITLGHTRQGEPEANQPDITGYALNFRVGRYGPEQKIAILSDFYVIPELESEFLKHPRRSVELFPNDDVFDPIAVLKRTPERDLGLITAYQRRTNAKRYVARLDGRPVRYSMEEANKMPEPIGLSEHDQAKADQFARHFACNDPVIKHAAEEAGEEVPSESPLSLKDQYSANRYMAHYMKHSGALRKAKKRYEAEVGKEIPDQYADEEALAPEEEETADAYFKHYASKSKAFRYAMGMDDDVPPVEPPVASEGVPPVAPSVEDTKQYAADDFANPEHPAHDPEGELDDDHAYTASRYLKHHIRNDPVLRKMYMAGAASATNSLPDGIDQKGPEQMSRETRDHGSIHYARENAMLKQKLAAVTARLDSTDREKNRAKAQACVQLLEAEGYKFDSHAKEVERFARMSDADRKERIAEVRRYHRQEGAPLGGQLPLAIFADPEAVAEVNGRGEPDRFSREDMGRALEMERDEKITIEAAIKKIKAEKAGRKTG